MPLPILGCIHVLKHLRTSRCNFNRPQPFGQGGYFEHTAVEGGFHCGQAAPPVIDAAKRLPGRHHSRNAIAGRGQNVPQKSRRQVRQVHGNDKVPVAIRMSQRAMNPAKGTGIGYDVLKDVFHRQGMQQVRVTDRGTDDGRAPSGSFASESRHALDLCEPISMGQQSLVRASAHAPALPARQQKRTNILHAGIIAAVAATLAFAGDATPVAKRQISSVTKDRRTGKLIRTVRVVDVPVSTPTPVPARTLKPVVVAPAPNATIQDIVDEASARHGVDPDLVHSVIRAESNYNPNAVSPVGASGLMQLMPATARQLGVLNAFNPKDNIEGGVKYLRYLQDKFQDPVLALAAYNAGPGSVEKYNKTVPPYRETQDYVVKVAKNYREAKKSKAAAAAVPAPVVEATKEPEAPKEPETRKVRAYQDANGRMYLSTQ